MPPSRSRPTIAALVAKARRFAHSLFTPPAPRLLPIPVEDANRGRGSRG